MHQLFPVLLRQVIEVEIRDTGRRVGIDENNLPARIAIFRQANPRNAVPLRERLFVQLLPLRIAHFQQMIFRIRDDRHGEEKPRKHTRDPSDLHTRQAEPDRRRPGKHYRNRNHRIRSAKRIEQQHQRQTPRGPAHQIKEINPVHPLDGLRNHQRNNDPRPYKRESSGEVNHPQFQGSDLRPARQHKQRRHQHQRRIHQTDNPQLAHQRPRPRRNHIGQYPAGTQTKQRNRDRQERKMVIEYN